MGNRERAFLFCSLPRWPWRHESLVCVHTTVWGLTNMILIFEKMRQEDGQEFKVILAIDQVPVQPGWQSETLALLPHQKKEALSMQNSLCIQSVHCDPDAFLPRWLHAAHCLTLPTLKYELGSIPCRHKQICPIPFKSYVVLDYMMQLKLKMSSTDENLTLILPLNF